MYTGLKKTLLIAFASTGLAALLVTAQDGAVTKAPAAKPSAKGNHFAIAYRESTPSGKAEGVPAVPPKTLRTLGEDLARRLRKQGLVRVASLDVQCCIVQLTLLDVPAGEDPKNRPLSVRVAVLDINNQPLYAKEFAATGSGSGKPADALASSLLADEKFVQVFKAH